MTAFVRLLIPFFLIGWLGYRSYRHAATQLQVSFTPHIDITTPGAPQLRGSVMITNPTPNPFYADSALLEISANGSKIAVAQITEPVWLAPHGDIEIQPQLTLSNDALAQFFRSYAGSITISVQGVVNVGPVALPVSFSKTLA